MPRIPGNRQRGKCVLCTECFKMWPLSPSSKQLRTSTLRKAWHEVFWPLEFFQDQLAGKSLVLQYDNEATVSALNTGYCWDSFMLACLRGHCLVLFTTSCSKAKTIGRQMPFHLCCTLQLHRNRSLLGWGRVGTFMSLTALMLYWTNHGSSTCRCACPGLYCS